LGGEPLPPTPQKGSCTQALNSRAVVGRLVPKIVRTKTLVRKVPCPAAAMRVEATVPDALAAALDEMAVELGVSRSQIIDEALTLVAIIEDLGLTQDKFRDML
jgi:hypothetical protein